MHDIDHPAPWGWKVSSYFLTKGIAAGAMMLAGVFAIAQVLSGAARARGDRRHRGCSSSPTSSGRAASTTCSREPQWRSWLALGAQVINVASARRVRLHRLRRRSARTAPATCSRWVMVPAGALLAGYTAFLFSQCEGRDLWQSRLLLPHTIVNAVVAGAAAMGIATLFGAEGAGTLRWALVASCVVSLVLIAIDTWGPHPTGQAERAARNLWRDRFGTRFFAGMAGLAAGALLPLIGAGTGLLAAGGRSRWSACGSSRTPGCAPGQSVPLS